MGEEEKKAPEEKKPEEKPAEEKKEEAAAAEKGGHEKKTEEAKEAAPPPPQEIVLKVYMHCEGCATKVRKCLKGFAGVEDVITDCKASKVVVKGEKADPMKVLERLQKKSHRQVELITPIPKPLEEEPKKPEPEEVVKVEGKVLETPVITVVLRVYMHCEACAQEIKKRIQRMKGVESVEPDLKSSQVTVKGKFEAEKLVDYVHKRTGKHVEIVKVEPAKKPEEKEKEDKKPENGEKDAKKGEGDDKDKKEGGGGAVEEAPPNPAPESTDDGKMEVKKNEFNQYCPPNYQVYPQRFVQDMNAYPPQIFSDENPNACSVM